MKSHAINNQQGEMEFMPHTKTLYECLWKAGISRYLAIKISVTNSMIYIVTDDTGHISLKTYENTPQNLKKAWARKRGAVRNFKKRESRWTAPGLESEYNYNNYSAI